MFLFRRKIKEVRVETLAHEVFDAELWPPLQLIQVGYLNLVPLRFQSRDSRIFQRTIERLDRKSVV